MNNVYANVSSVTFYREYERDARVAKDADTTISLSDYANRQSLLLTGISRPGRHASFAARIEDLSGLSSGSVLNFGDDGETVIIRNRSGNKFRVELPIRAYGDYYLNQIELGSPSFMNHTEVQIGSAISLSGAGNSDDIMVVTIDKNGRHADLFTTFYGITRNTSGTVLNFGDDGEIITMTGDGSSGFSIATSVSGLSSVFVSVAKVSANTKGYQLKNIVNASVGSQTSIALDSSIDLYDMFIVCVNQNGRQAGICGIGVDLINVVFGVVMNFGSDGQVIEFIGNGKKGISVAPSNGGAVNLIISELVLPSEYHTGETVVKNTFSDYHMVPMKRLGVNPSTPNYSIVQISGTEKRTDITDYLPTGMYKSSRSGSWSFYVDHYRWPDGITAFETISKFLNGHKVLAVLEEDPMRAYEGYVKVSNYSPGRNYSSFTIDYDFDAEPKTAVSRAPIRFIKSDGTYHSTEYVFDPGIDYVFPIDGMSFYGKDARMISLSGGMYSRTPVKSGGLVKFSGILNKNAIALFSISGYGRFCGFSGTPSEIMNVSSGEIFNFGSDGETIQIIGNGYSGFTIKPSSDWMTRLRVTISEAEYTAVISNQEVNTGSYISLSGVSDQDAIMVFSVTKNRKHISFCSTAHDLVSNTAGTMYSFGIDGHTIVVTGNGSNSFKMEVSDASITSVNLTAVILDAENYYTNEDFGSGDDITVRFASGNASMVFVSAYYNGRRVGFLGAKTDIYECVEGSVFNFGADGEIAELVGDNRGFYSLNADIIGNNDLYVTTAKLN